MKVYNIIGKTNQSFNSVLNGKTFYTPVKGKSVTVKLNEIPQFLKDLEKNNIVAIKEVK